MVLGKLPGPGVLKTGYLWVVIQVDKYGSWTDGQTDRSLMDGWIILGWIVGWMVGWMERGWMEG